MEDKIDSYKNETLNLTIRTYVGKNNTIWFRGKDIASSLGYARPRNAILDHVDAEYKTTFKELVAPTPGEQPHAIWVSELGVLSLIFSARMVNNKPFVKWILGEVLPSIRKDISNRKRFDSPNKLVFKIENEFDLHSKVVEYMRKYYPNALLVAGLGELQDTSRKRIDSWKKGYQKGQPDLIVLDQHERYNGLCIEFKTPLGNGVVSDSQEKQHKAYRGNNYKVIVSNDYDHIVREIHDYSLGFVAPLGGCEV